jgi:hypothetical protein
MLTSKVLKIKESAFGGDILTISHDNSTIESRGFINGRTIPEFLIEGDIVEYDIYFNELANKHFAKILGLYDYPISRDF